MAETLGEGCMQERTRLDDLIYDNQTRLLGYMVYLKKTRLLQTGTLSMHASMVVTVLRYLSHTTRKEGRAAEYTKLLKEWRAFRNRLASEHSRVIRERDMDTARENGALVPTYSELMMVSRFLVDRVCVSK